MRRCFLLLLVVLLLAAGCAGDRNASVAASVNGDPIPIADVEQRVESIRTSEQFAEQFANDPDGALLEQASAQVLTSLIQSRILERAADEELGLEIGQEQDDAQREAIIEEVGGQEEFDALVEQNGLSEEQLDDELHNAAVQEAIRAELAADVTDEDVEAFYEENRDARYGPNASARHILVEDEATARQALDRINGGEDFAAVAGELSTDTGSAEQGGDLGQVTPGQTVPEFDDAVFNSPIGELVGPIQTEFGWHVLEVLERNDEGQPLSEVEDEIRTELDATAGQQEFQQFAQEQSQAAEVEVNPRFGQWDPATGQVTPGDPLGEVESPLPADGSAPVPAEPEATAAPVPSE